LQPEVESEDSSDDSSDESDEEPPQKKVKVWSFLVHSFHLRFCFTNLLFLVSNPTPSCAAKPTAKVSRKESSSEEDDESSEESSDDDKTPMRKVWLCKILFFSISLLCSCFGWELKVLLMLREFLR
jgi:nucleolin